MTVVGLGELSRRVPSGCSLSLTLGPPQRKLISAWPPRLSVLASMVVWVGKEEFPHVLIKPEE